MLLVPLTRSSSDLACPLVRLFNDCFDRPCGRPAASEAASPALDVAETERGYSVTVDLPGVAKDDVKITIGGLRVGVSAQSRREENRKNGERVICRERSCASFARSFALSEEIGQEAATAKLDNGVLTLVLPKKGATAATSITVN